MNLLLILLILLLLLHSSLIPLSFSSPFPGVAVKDEALLLSSSTGEEYPQEFRRSLMAGPSYHGEKKAASANLKKRSRGSYAPESADQSCDR